MYGGAWGRGVDACGEGRPGRCRGMLRSLELEGPGVAQRGSRVKRWGERPVGGPRGGKGGRLAC